MAERKYYKAINFDLDTKVLNDIHPSGSYNKAYYDLKKFFLKNNFEHRQGSGYLSKEKIDSSEVYDIIGELGPEFPWLMKSAKKIDVTNVGREFDALEELRMSDIDVEIIEQ